MASLIEWFRSLLRWLFGEAKTLPASKGAGGVSLPASVLARASLVIPSFPATIELVPGAVRATVALGELGSEQARVQCWVYVTDGLSGRGQRELILPLRIGAGQDPARPPTEPLQFFHDVAQLAAEGRIVGDGGQSEMRKPFLGGQGLVYVSAPYLDGVETPEDALLALRVCREELEVFRAHGLTRLLSAIGNAYRYYPYPPWSEVDRPPIVSLDSLRGSLLDEVPRLPVRAWVRKGASGICLEIPDDQRSLLAKLGELSADAGFALLTRIDPMADGCLVWSAGQEEPAAITPPGSEAELLCGAFLLCLPDQEEDGARLHEDGFALFLTSASAAAFRQALVAGEALSLPGTKGNLDFSLIWAPTTYQDPASGMVLPAPGGLRQYHPKNPAPSVGPVQVTHLMLLTSEAALARRVRTKPLADFLKKFVALAESTLGASRNPEVVVDVKLDPGQPAVITVIKGNRDEAIHLFCTQAASLPPPPVRGGQVAVRVFCVIAPKDAPN